MTCHFTFTREKRLRRSLYINHTFSMFSIREYRYRLMFVFAKRRVCNYTKNCTWWWWWRNLFIVLKLYGKSNIKFWSLYWVDNLKKNYYGSQMFFYFFQENSDTKHSSWQTSIQFNSPLAKDLMESIRPFTWNRNTRI